MLSSSGSSLSAYVYGCSTIRAIVVIVVTAFQHEGQFIPVAPLYAGLPSFPQPLLLSVMAKRGSKGAMPSSFSKYDVTSAEI
jgi:hypothetical protein